MSQADQQKLLSISEFAAELGVSVRVLRHYDAEGVLAPAQRDYTGVRLYAPEQLDRARNVVDLVAAGLPLRLVRSLLIGVDESGDIAEQHQDEAALAEIEDHYQRMCRCVECIQQRRDALGAYLERVSQRR
ncbi:MerR family transcriptional regulator [Psychromicrobium lacuslunae]|uniref:HTH merR-type domain-containing protein n=1 Tax=Psychromicrobium lacuslunae TaxID=1618207 RepID=A0A0D4BYE4_9MICC|nr:MerR family transcriptional regulator [Psychromicrobium lacuslunae]AJT41140.1 hypothetical protein UM93_05685 [Psychromicrobium lacuslunae]